METLPIEIIKHIGDYLELKDLSNLSMVCKRYDEAFRPYIKDVKNNRPKIVLMEYEPTQDDHLWYRHDKKHVCFEIFSNLSFKMVLDVLKKYCNPRCRYHFIDRFIIYEGDYKTVNKRIIKKNLMIKLQKSFGCMVDVCSSDIPVQLPQIEDKIYCKLYRYGLHDKMVVFDRSISFDDFDNVLKCDKCYTIYHDQDLIKVYINEYEQCKNIIKSNDRFVLEEHEFLTEHDRNILDKYLIN